MLRVYEHFARIPRSAAGAAAAAAGGTAPPPGGGPVVPGAGGTGIGAGGAAGIGAIGGGIGSRFPGDDGKGGGGGGGQLDLVAYLERYMQWQARADATVQAREAEGPASGDQSALQQLLTVRRDVGGTVWGGDGAGS